uniref:Uncharacterized protein n=1 Tax=Arundo donax TaxID=35708 RepID=A0A0A9F3L9_ARUDO
MRQPFTLTINKDGDLPLLLRRWPSTQYPAQLLSLSGCHPLTSLRISGVSGLGVLISRDLHSNFSNDGLGLPLVHHIHSVGSETI